MRRLLLPLTLVSALLLAGCTASRPEPPRPTEPALRLASGRTTAVVDAASPAQRAVQTSRALFAASPGVVLAPEGDPDTQRAAGRTAERLHVPLLLVPASTGSPAPSTGPAAAEAHRLGARWSVGPGLRIPGLRPRSAARTEPEPAPRPDSAVVVATGDDDVAALATATAARARVVRLPEGTDLNGDASAVRALSGAKDARAVLVGRAFAGGTDLAWSVAAARTGWTYAGGSQRAFDGRSLHVALYGTPGDRALGVLGHQGEAATLTRVRALGAQYAALTDRTVSPMLEVIATVAAGGPTDDGDYSGEVDAARLEPYVDAALAAHVPVILDLQPGRQDFLSQAKQYASLLEKPGVGLALDPEWRLGPKQKPLVQIGRVSAAEVNRTSAWLAGLVRAKGLPPKPFVLHEFRLTMLQDRSSIVVDRPELDTLIHVDGQGGQPDKQATWRAVRNGAPHVAWGWKNFLETDHPVLTPKQTLQQVHPTPDLITYQ
ncbi:hypothetical protein GCM10025783_02240 [Amnibacterium soli]|uniref:Lipoprotein n=1 Tax=Amnibacterium soli TaxID=1282736 RepID=A0ABP8YSR6_9MICO